MRLNVTLSANAGICLDLGSMKIWVDAFHDRKVLGFSTVSPELYDRIMNSDAFANPSVVCVTHCHPDHYSENLLRQALSFYPHAKLLIPDASFGNEFTWEEKGVRLTFLRLTHDGEAYANCLHYGILLTVAGKNILIPGDCRLCDTAFAEAVKGLEIDLAFLNFPWLTLNRAESFARQQICPRQVVVYHLPFEKDDVNRFRIAAERSAEKWGNQAHLLMNPLETISLDI